MAATNNARSAITHQIIASADDGYLALDSQFHFIYANGAAQRLLGVKEADLSGRCQWEVFPQTLGTEIETAYRRAMSECVAVSCEYRLEPLHRWCDIQARPAGDGGLFVRFRDITEHKGADDAVRRERALLNGIMQATDVMLVYLDPDFNFVTVNAAYAETCKMRPEDLIGKNHFAIYPGAENEAIFRRVRDSGEPVFYKDKPFEFPDQPERGVTYWDWSLTPVKDGSGAVVGLVFSLRETTKYKRAEESVRRLAQFPEENPNPVLRVANDGRFLYANPSARVFVEAMGDGGGKQALPAALQNLVAGVSGHGQAVEAEISDGRGGVFWFTAVRPPGEQYINLYGRNVTEHKRAEEALQKSEKLLRSVLEVLPVGVFMMDGAGNIQDTNPAVRDIWGNVRLVGTSGYSQYKLWRSDTGKPPEMHERPGVRAIQTGRPVLREMFEIESFDGQRKTILISAVPIRDPDGTVTGIIGVNEDITELRASQAAIERDREIIRELSTPVLPVDRGLLIVPLIGAIDPRRARQLTEQLLTGIRQNRAKVVVINVTGVGAIDSSVANHLVQTAEAARLLGAQVILTGVSTSVALTLVTVGVNLGSLKTLGDLQSGIEEANRTLQGAGPE